MRQRFLHFPFIENAPHSSVIGEEDSTAFQVVTVLIIELGRAAVDTKPLFPLTIGHLLPNSFVFILQSWLRIVT